MSLNSSLLIIPSDKCCHSTVHITSSKQTIVQNPLLFSISSQLHDITLPIRAPCPQGEHNAAEGYTRSPKWHILQGYLANDPCFRDGFLMNFLYPPLYIGFRLRTNDTFCIKKRQGRLMNHINSQFWLQAGHTKNWRMRA